MNNIWRIIRAIWGIGNFLARLAIIIVASWPLLVTFAAFVGSPTLTAIVALLPLVAVVLILISFGSHRGQNQLQPNQQNQPRRRGGQPLIFAAIGAVWPTFLKTAALVIGTELAIGVYFAAVPVANDRGLIPLALLVILAIIFFVLSGWKIRMVVTALVTLFIVLTAIFLLGGRDEAKEEAKKAVEWVSKSKAVLAPTTAAQPPIEEFSFNKGDTLGTVWAEAGTKHVVEANKQWLLLCGNHSGGHKMSAGNECINGMDPAGIVKVVGLFDGTVLKFQKKS